jgi:hypothetical protein
MAKSVEPAGGTHNPTGVSAIAVAPETRAVEIAAEHDEERPARQLSRSPDLLEYFVSGAVALLVLKQVFFRFSKGNQYYLVIFLGCTLPLLFRCYRPRERRSPEGPDDPEPIDWVFAALIPCS